MGEGGLLRCYLSGKSILRLERGKPMRYVYLLRSLSHPNQHYVGSTQDIHRRLKEHNTGGSSHTNKFVPWKCVVAICFTDDAKADAFERYLKSGSGRAFAGRHFW